MRATKSHVSGAFRLVAGKQVTINDVAVALQPLDLDLVRELFGGGPDPKMWQGTATGTVFAAGGPFTAFRLDSARLAYEDRKASGAVSHIAAAGSFDLQSKPVAFQGLDITVQPLDVRTLANFASAVDSLHGQIAGHVILDGPANDLQFTELSLRHTDGDHVPSRVTGEGRVASNRDGEWFNARLTIDTIAIATLTRDRSAVPLRGIVRGTVGLRADRDTMAITALLHTGADSVRFAGATLLDSGRTRIHGEATCSIRSAHHLRAARHPQPEALREGRRRG